MSGGASFDAPGQPGTPTVDFTGGLPNTVGAPVNNQGLTTAALQLMIQAWNTNTAALGALLTHVGGTITGDVSGGLPGPVEVIATHLGSPLPINQGGTGNSLGEATPAGAAGGDLGGTFPDPVVNATHLLAPLPVAQGGLGIGSGTSGGILAFTAPGVVGSSGLLTQHALVVGGGAGVAPSTLGSLGTTTTVLHGNAAGLPAFGAVVLTTDVSGILPLTNGGTGEALGGTTGTGNLVLSASPTFTGTTLMAALTLSGEELLTHQDGVIALAGGGRTGSPILTSQMNRISVVATAADSAQLPAAVAGDFRVVINDGAHAAQIFGNGGDTIDGVAGTTGVPLTNAKRAIFFSTTSGHWYSLSGGVSA